MEKIEINTFERDKAINKAVTEAISTIRLNASNGIQVTEFYFPREIGGSIKAKITELLKDSKTRFDWCIVKKGVNEFNGNVMNFTTDTIGDSKYCKLKIY